MKQKIYLDVLFLINVYVTFFLILSSEKLLCCKALKIRKIIGCVLGGLYSLIIIFDMNLTELIFIKLFMGISIVMIVFWKKRPAYMLKATGIFFVVNIIFGGFMYCLWLFFAPASMAYKNGVPYFNISVLTLAVTTIAAYLIVLLFCKFKNRSTKKEQIHRLVIENGGRETMLTAFEDTGNKLCDVFSGLPVVVCDYASVKGLFPKVMEDFLKNGVNSNMECIENSALRTKIKLIPITTANGNGVLPSFKPDKIILDDREVYALIAVSKQISDGGYDAICPSSLLNT